MGNTQDSSDSSLEAALQNNPAELSSPEMTGQNSITHSGHVRDSSFVTGQKNIVGDYNSVNISNNHYSSSPDQELPESLSKIYLEEISIDESSIQSINSELKAIFRMAEVGFLSENHADNLDLIKREIINLEIGQLNLKLKQINSITRKLFEACKQELLKKKAAQLLNGDASDCNDQYLKIIETLQMDFEDADEVAEWLDSNRKRMAKHFGKAALTLFPENQSQVSKEKVARFYFSINQFLEQLAHCLRWGRPNILDDPGILLEFESEIYIEAFNLIQKDLPSHLSKEGKSQLNEYIDYLVELLPTY